MIVIATGCNGSNSTSCDILRAFHVTRKKLFFLYFLMSLFILLLFYLVVVSSYILLYLFFWYCKCCRCCRWCRYYWYCPQRKVGYQIPSNIPVGKYGTPLRWSRSHLYPQWRSSPTFGQNHTTGRKSRTHAPTPTPSLLISSPFSLLTLSFPTSSFLLLPLSSPPTPVSTLDLLP